MLKQQVHLGGVGTGTPRGVALRRVVVAAAVAVVVAVAWAVPAGTEFTYQGRLKKNGNLVTGLTDFRFSLWDDPVAGTQIGPTLEFSNDPAAVGPPVQVTRGLFKVELDFGLGAFDGSERWLQIEVRHPSGDPSGFAVLSQRQKVTATPYAIVAIGQSRLAASDGDPADALVVDAAGNVGIGTATPSGPLTVESSLNINADPQGNLGNKIAPLVVSEPGTPLGILIDSNQIEQAGGNNALYLNFNSPAKTLINLGGGNVGIGTLDPQAKLEVRSGGSNAPALIFGDPFGVGKLVADSNGVVIQTQNGQDAIFVRQSDGAVGIGTDSPRTPLEVVGDITATNLQLRSPDPFIDFYTGSNPANITARIIQWTATSPLQVVGPGLAVDGSMGVGTSAPEANIHVRPTGGTPAARGEIRVDMTSEGDGSPNSLILAADGSFTQGVAIIDTAHQGVAAATPLSIRAEGVEAIRVQPNGQVGINKPDPDLALEIGGDFGRNDGPSTMWLYGSTVSDTGDGLHLSSGNGIVHSDNTLIVAGDVTAGNVTATGIIGGGDFNGRIIELSSATPFIDFHAQNSSADFTARIIQYDPLDQLHVEGPGLAVGGNVEVGNGTGPAFVDFHAQGGTSGDFSARMIQWTETGPLEVLADTGAGLAPLTFRINGKLELVDSGLLSRFRTGAQGRLRLEGDISGLKIAGDLVADSCNCSSDARLKRDVATFQSGLDVVERLRPVRFRWRCQEFPDRKFTNEPQIGFIAQEVLKVLPELVTQDEDGYYAMDYGRLTAVLTAAVQELHRVLDAQTERVEQAEQRIEKLEAANAELRAANEALRQRLDDQQTQLDELKRQLAELRAQVAGHADVSAGPVDAGRPR